jgi:hypothetical protein
MAIIVKCDCGKSIQAPDALAGKRGKCPGCGNVVMIPVPSAPVIAAEPDEFPAIASTAPTRSRATSIRTDAKQAVLCFQSAEPRAVASDVGSFFKKEGYRLESGTPLKGIYGKGSDVMRILLGGFAKRYKFDITIQPQDQYVWVTIGKGMSGAMGGAIGYMAMNKEANRVFAAMKTYFG